LATGFYRTGANRRLPTFNYDRDALPAQARDANLAAEERLRFRQRA